ncbi:hypothetical protein D3C76_679490 [compost metagenome]
MTTVIMNIVEWSFVVGFVMLGLYPHLSYYAHHRTLKGILIENGVGYCVALQIAARDRLLDVVAAFSILFFLAAVMPKVAMAAAIYFFHITFLIHCAIRAGYRFGTYVR